MAPREEPGLPSSPRPRRKWDFQPATAIFIYLYLSQVNDTPPPRALLHIHLDFCLSHTRGSPPSLVLWPQSSMKGLSPALSVKVQPRTASFPYTLKKIAHSLIHSFIHSLTEQVFPRGVHIQLLSRV